MIGKQPVKVVLSSSIITTKKEISNALIDAFLSKNYDLSIHLKTVPVKFADYFAESEYIEKEH
ncbi:hypothetical protein ACVWYN_002709 [Pedobacter sp. UYP24]